MIEPDFAATDGRAAPFPHFRVSGLLSEADAGAILNWLDIGAPWTLHVADFYEQFEFSLMNCEMPGEIEHIRSTVFVRAIGRELSRRLDATGLELVDICCHRLTPGQTIRIHNDAIGDQETHRLVVQLNRGWSPDQGGLFMLFERDDPESVTDVMLPTHRSAFGFEISRRSYHAVSTIRSGHRDSLVYTYRKSA